MKENDINTLFAAYMDELELAGKSRTHVRYAFRQFQDYLSETDVDPLLLKVKEAQEFQVYLTAKTDATGRPTLSKAAVLNIIGSMTNLYDFLKRRRSIASNPFWAIDRVKRNKSLPRNVPSIADMNRFLDCLRHFDQPKSLIEKRLLYKGHVVAELMYSTGARIGEICRLKPSDIDFEKNTVALIDSKNGKIRTGFLCEYASEVLKRYVEEMRPLVLFARNGGDSDLLFGAKANLKTWFNALIQREAEKLGMKRFTSHVFRHALGYHLLKNGCDIRLIQEILGHKQLNTTQVYTKVDKEDLKNVIDRFHPRHWKSKETSS